MQANKQRIPDLAHFAMPMVYQITGETILKCKTLIKYPETEKI